MKIRWLLVASAAAAVGACSRTPTPPEPFAAISAPPPSSSTQAPAAAVAPEASAPPVPASPAFHAELLAIAASYTAMPRADGTWWAPEDCKAPIHPAFVSKAESGAHGRKIYTLFVKDIGDYAALSGRKVGLQPGVRKMPALDAMSQVIVKESWTPVESAVFREQCKSERPNFFSEVTMDGKRYRACEQAGLFVMYRAAAGTEGTDDGWVYGTVQYEARPGEHEGQTVSTPRVTAAGKVGSCMGCHTKAPHGRLFGMPPGG